MINKKQEKNELRKDQRRLIKNNVKLPSASICSKNHRGITLIALVITIIVMLILVGVTIAVAINGGLFGMTKNAAMKTEIATYEEKIENLRAEMLVDKIVNDLTGKDYIDKFEQELKKDVSFKDSNITRKDDETIVVVTPEGYVFEITEEETKYVGKQDKNNAPPTLTESDTAISYEPSGWTNKKVTVSIETEKEGYTLQYSTDGRNWDEYKVPFEVEENETVIYARLMNEQYQIGGVLTGTVLNIDNEAPTVNTELTATATGTKTSTAELSTKVADTLSGISKIVWYYKLSDASSYTSVTDEYATMNGEEKGDVTATGVTKTHGLTGLTAGKTYNAYAEVYDVAGNKTRTPESGTVDVTMSEITISLDKSSAVVGVDNTISLTATTNPNNQNVIWTSSDDSIAKITVNSNESAIVQGMMGGSVIITAQVEGTNKKATCKIESKSRFSSIYSQTEKASNGNAMIPKGFAVGVSSDVNSEEKGLVITDQIETIEGNNYSVGNEFVWIPVTYTATGELVDHDLDSGFLAVFYRSDWSNNARSTKIDDSSTYTEPCAKGYLGEDTDYYEMMKSVQDNGGFYIGRYEAGSTTPRTSDSAGDTTMVVKRDQYPYNNVAWGKSMSNIDDPINSSGHGAVYLSKHMYDDKDVGVTSTLCYGVEWDAMLDFIKDNTHWVTRESNYCTTWGNHYDNPWTITRTQAKSSKYDSENYKLGEWTNISDDGLTKTYSESYLLTTGASNSFSAKNIYDVAGNCDEWTMEADSKSRVFHGGSWRGSGSDGPASYRNNTGTRGTYDSTSFRPALYIKKLK